MKTNTIYHGNSVDVLRTLPDGSIDCCITSPPYYGLRDYGVQGQLGLEPTPEAYVVELVNVFREVNRVLKPEGTLWLNLGDSYAGSGRGKGDVNKKGIQPKHSFVGDIFSKPYKLQGYKNKDLIGIPWLVAFALRESGWYLRQDIIWHKPNPMPEGVTDRCTKAHEYIFLLSKSPKYYYNSTAIKTAVKQASITRSQYGWHPEKLLHGTNYNGWKPTNKIGDKASPATGANKRSVWTVSVAGFKGAHFATFPEKLIVDMVKAGSPEQGVVLDPFMGAGTTAVVAKKLGRDYVGIELNYEYIKIAERRLGDVL